MHNWKVALLMMMIVALIGAGGCTPFFASDDAKAREPDGDGAPLSFQEESAEKLPEAVKKIRSEVMAADSEKLSHREVRSGDRTYLILSLGQRPTGGYAIQVEKVVRKGDTIQVIAEESPPPKGSFNTQVITQPTTVISLETPDEEVQYRYRLKESP
ncbi:MAG: protease complex subunit PrcB family protein [Firmicutes bacterium]|nr:protease complex subunit PrcB family protein [Bacillota bacterium]